MCTQNEAIPNHQNQIEIEQQKQQQQKGNSWYSLSSSSMTTPSPSAAAAAAVAAAATSAKQSSNSQSTSTPTITDHFPSVHLLNDKNLLAQFSSPSIPGIHAHHHQEKRNFPSCRFPPQENFDLFYKYANMNSTTMESASGGRPPSQYSTILSDISSISPAQTQSTLTVNGTTNNGQIAAATNAQGGNANTGNMNNTNSMYGSHFSPVGYHMTIPQSMMYDSAAANARTCALPSPTIYPPTPPPSAPWIHPWFVGDTF